LIYSRYWQLDPNKVRCKKGHHPKETWDMAVFEASEEYKKRMVGLISED